MTSPSRARTWLAGVTAVGLLATSAPAVATPAEQPSDPSATTAPPSADTMTQQPDAVHSVTLVTGDVVTVTTLDDGTQTATVESAPDASGRVLTHVDDDELMVIPHEALPYLAAGVMDQDLFNMSLLIDQGYADEDRATIPVIVQWDRAARGAKGVEGADTTLALESIGAQAMETDKAQATDFWQSVTAGSEPGELRAGVARVHLDRVVEASLTESVPLIGADQAWEAGLTGEGVTVAVLDTGADLDHPDLVDVVTDSTSFVPDEGVEDANGHGTHVASTIAGSGAASAAEGGPVLKGVAPDADLVVGKVLGDDGYGMESWIIDGMEWAAERADVVNMSLGNTVPDDGTEPMAVALQQLSEETGTLFVVASGNLGRAGGVGSPGSAEAALTVAATDKAGNRAYFSDHGPRLGPEGLVKPDLSAPGQEIVAARSQSAPGEGWYFANTGTSMATPHVAGAAAILAQQEPDWTGQQLKDALMSSTKDLAGPWDGPYQVGTGIVDVPGALGAQVVATGSVSFGFYDWPHEGDAPVTREVTYTNVTDAPIDLAVQVRVPEGVVLPEGLLSLSADTVTVPAGGTASVEVTVDPELAPVPSALSGWVVASAGDTEVARTGWGVAKEEERYDVTLRATDRDGSPGTATVVYKRAGDFFTFFTTVEGEQTLRLPGGPYSFTTFMDITPAPGETGVAFMGDPVLDLTGDVIIDLDAREAAEISVDVPDASVAEVFRRMEFDVQAPVTVDGFDTVLAVSNAYLLPPTVDRIYAGPITEDPEVFEYRTRWRLRTPFIEVSEDGTVLDVHGLGGAAMPAADAVLPAVYAGTGTQSEVDAVDAAGAAVVVTRDRTQPLWDVASRIETAGAELVVVVNDEPGDFVEGLIGPEGQELGIPAVGMSGTQGAGFVPRVEAGEVELTLSGGRTSPVVYDLVDPYAGTVPADLRYAPSEDELVRIDSTYHGDRDRQGGEFRYDFGRFTRFGLGFHQVLDVPQERVEWVSAQEHTEWYQDVVLLDGSWNERGTRTSYEPGARTSQDWLAAVVQPRLGEGYWLPNRQGNYLQVNLPSWAGDEPTHTGGMGVSDGTDDQVIRWYDGDTLLQETVGWQSDGLDLVGVTERTQLRVTNDVARDPAAWPTSVRSSTEWTFWTEAPADWFAELPFVQVDFEVDTDVTGTARSAAADTIGLSAWLPPGTALAGEVVEGSLAISYDDGDTWQDLELTGDAGDWTAEVVHPVGAEHASLRGTAVDDMGNAVAMEVVRAFLIPDAPVAEVERVAGTDRYGTAALLAGDYAPGGVVYVASGADHADALSAAALAGHGEVPVLLTRPGQLPDDTRAELERLEPADIVVVGGEVAVAEEVVTELEDLTDGDVTRLSGPDRYGTAAEVAGVFGTGVPVAYVASGRDFPDALAGGARAGALGGPVLLTRPGALPEATLAALEELAPERIVLLGGTGAVSEAVAETLEDVAAVERTYGTDRYGTAAEVAGDVAPGAPVVYLATGRDFPDALSGSAVAGAQDAPVLLTRPQQLPEDTVAELLRLRPARVVLLGGTGAIESVVEDELEELLAGP